MVRRVKIEPLGWVVLVLLVAGITALVTWALRPSPEAPAVAASTTPETAGTTATPAPSTPPAADSSSTAAKPADPEPPVPAVAKHSPPVSRPKIAAADTASCREIVTVHFLANSSDLAPDELTRLRESFTRAGELKGKIEISAYCDDVGAADWNLVLSRRRASEVAKAVASIQPDLQLETRGFGSNDPVIPNDSWKARARNRRAEVRICEPAAK